MACITFSPGWGPTRSGAMAMYPASASSSAASRAQSLRPKISWITTTDVALCETSG